MPWGWPNYLARSDSSWYTASASGSHVAPFDPGLSGSQSAPENGLRGRIIVSVHATRALGKSSPPGRELFERYRLLGIGSEKTVSSNRCSLWNAVLFGVEIAIMPCTSRRIIPFLSTVGRMVWLGCFGRGRVGRPIRGTEKTGSSSALNKLPFKWFDLPFSLTINQGRGLVFPRMLQEMLIQLRGTAGPASPMPSQQCHAAEPVFLDLGCVGLTSTWWCIGCPPWHCVLGDETLFVAASYHCQSDERRCQRTSNDAMRMLANC